MVYEMVMVMVMVMVMANDHIRHCLLAFANTELAHWPNVYSLRNCPLNISCFKTVAVSKHGNF